MKNNSEAKPPATEISPRNLHARTDIPAFPKFYKLFYTNTANTSPSFNERIKSFLGNGMPKTGVIKNLYNKYLKFEALDEKIIAASEKMSKKIGSVSTAIRSTSHSAKAFTNSLQQATSTLSGNIGAADLKSLTQNLLEDTADMQATNTELENRLQDAQKDVVELQKNLEAIQKQSMTDSLTSINNRKFFDQNISIALENANTNNEPMCLVMLDIDHFKNFNDTFGHQTGDQVLRLVGTALQSNVRECDLVCRFGGEEFVMILPNTNLQGAKIVAEKVRKAIQEKELLKRSKNKNLGVITASFGIAELRPTDTETTLIERADKSLYVAKNSGRNCVKGEDDEVLNNVSAA